MKSFPLVLLSNIIIFSLFDRRKEDLNCIYIFINKSSDLDKKTSFRDNSYEFLSPKGENNIMKNIFLKLIPD